MRRVAGLFSLIIFGFLAVAPTAKAVDLGGISAAPANPIAADERTSSWFVYALAPQGTKNDELTITNNTDKEIILDIYPADSTPTTGNGFALKQRAETMTEVGSWIRLETDSLTIPAREKASIKFSLIVPSGRSPGLYAGGIMISERANGTKRNGVDISMRMGVRVYVTVTSPLARPNPVSPFIAYIIGAAAVVLAIGTALKIKNRKK